MDPDRTAAGSGWARPHPRGRLRPATAYAGAVALIAVTTALAWVARDVVHIPDAEMLFVLAVLLAAVRLGRGPSFLAAGLGVASYDYFIVDPPFSLDPSDARYLLTFAMMFGVGIVVSSLASRLRRQTQDAELRERVARAQGALAVALGQAKDEGEAAAAAARFFTGAFGGSAALLRRSPAGTEVLAASGQVPDDRVLASAARAMAGGPGAGDGVLCVPLLSGSDPVGLLALYPWDGAEPGATSLVEASGRQVATALERARLASEARRAELRAATERLRGDLLSAVSHDLRTPLAVITGAASALRDGAALGATERSDLVEGICEEAERMERLVGNVLDLMRLEGGTVDLRKEWLPLDEVAGSALSRVERQLGVRPVAVDVSSAPPVLAEPVLLEHALVNLLENAAKYSPPGAPVEVRAALEGDRVLLEVADRGPGIPAGQEERIFERFHRGVHPGVTGVGLGLAIAKAVAHAHEGELSAMRRPGGGTVFRLALPHRGLPPPMRRAGPPAEPVPPEARR